MAYSLDYTYRVKWIQQARQYQKAQKVLQNDFFVAPFGAVLIVYKSEYVIKSTVSPRETLISYYLSPHSFKHTTYNTKNESSLSLKLISNCTQSFHVYVPKVDLSRVIDKKLNKHSFQINIIIANIYVNISNL